MTAQNTVKELSRVENKMNQRLPLTYSEVHFIANGLTPAPALRLARKLNNYELNNATKNWTAKA